MASTKETTSPADLVDRIRKGSKEAEDELVQRYRRGALRIIKQKVGNSSDVDELVQQTLMTALERIRHGAVREPEKLSGYVCGIATNLAQAHLREAQSERLKDIDEVAQPIDPQPSPFEQLLIKEEAEIARQVIGELPVERDREILTRYYLNDEEKDSICESMGLTSIQFNRVISRALARFRELGQEKLRLRKSRD